MLKIVLFHVKDKQAFVKLSGVPRFAGNPVEVGKKLKDEGCKLIHIIDEDALKGMTKNLDVYNALTFFINVQVECAPQEEIVKKLLSLRCRVVLPPDADISDYEEKNLLVAKLPDDYKGDAKGFNDVIVSSEDQAKRMLSLKKRVMMLGESKQKLWGTISPLTL
jgi:uncharacterized protein related to proFAR isomerase